MNTLTHVVAVLTAVAMAVILVTQSGLIHAVLVRLAEVQ
jgi:hypothetical protein